MIYHKFPSYESGSGDWANLTPFLRGNLDSNLKRDQPVSTSERAFVFSAKKSKLTKEAVICSCNFDTPNAQDFKLPYNNDKQYPRSDSIAPEYFSRHSYKMSVRLITLDKTREPETWGDVFDYEVASFVGVGPTNYSGDDVSYAFINNAIDISYEKNRVKYIFVPIEKVTRRPGASDYSTEIGVGQFRVPWTSSAPLGFGRIINFAPLGEDLVPHSIKVNHTENELVVAFENSIVIYDLDTDEHKITYSFSDPNRDNRINDLVIDEQQSRIICTTRNTNKRYDTIHVLYYDRTNGIFSEIATFSEGADSDYNSLFLNNGYLYTNSINNIDSDGRDTLRSNLGLKILKITTAGGTTFLDLVNSIPFGEYWNDDQVPLDKTDFGFLPLNPTLHYKILDIDGSTMSVLCNRKREVRNQDEPEKSGHIEKCFVILYDISDPVNIQRVGSHVKWSDYHDFVDFFIFEKDTASLSAEKYFFESSGNTNNYSKEDALVEAPLIFTSKAYLINTKNIELMQEILLDNLPHSNTTDVSGDVLFVANGDVGFKMFYLDKNLSKPQYKILYTVKPKSGTKEYPVYDVNYRFVGVNDMNNVLVCGSKNEVFTFHYSAGALIQTDGRAIPGYAGGYIYPGYVEVEDSSRIKFSTLYEYAPGYNEDIFGTIGGAVFVREFLIEPSGTN